MTDKPHFRFHPRAYELDVFEASDAPCALCEQPCVWSYGGIVYSAAPQPAPLCARCIANGSLGKRLGEEDWALQDAELEDADPALEREVLQGTPGVMCFNAFAWPVRDGEPLVFVGYGDDKAVLAKPGVRRAISEAFDGEADESPYALVFMTLDGESYQVVQDYD